MGTSLDESAAWAGRHRWIENRLYEIAGAWVPSTPDVEAKLLFDRHSHHHAWRAAQWWDRLPVLADVDREAQCRPPSASWDDFTDRLRQTEGTVGRLAGLYRVALPRLFGFYTAHARVAGDLADGATVRTLGMVRVDVAADWQEGELMLQARAVDQASVAAAADAVQVLEGILARS